MACVLENTYLDFKNSGAQIRPVDLMSRQEEGKDDQFRAKITKQAGTYLSSRIIDREPVEWNIAGEPVWRGWVEQAGLTVGKTTASIVLNDPLKILEMGVIDKEFYVTTIDQVVNYIWEQMHDGQGVLRGPEFTAPSGNIKTQHNPPFADVYEAALATWALEQVPLINFDGQLDFRGENPREALAEVCRVFNTTMFVRPDGTFVIGPPDMEPNVYGAGTHEGTWKLTNYNIPESKRPVGSVYVKGASPTIWKGPIEEAPGRLIDDMKNVTPWAVASISGHEGSPTAISYTRTSDKQKLKDVAKRYLIQQYRESHSGTASVDIFGSPGGINTVGGLKVGDILSVESDLQCDVPGGNFRINAVQHDWNSNDGYLIHFDLVGLIPASIETKAWDYNPLDPSMNSLDPSLFWITTMPVVPLSIIVGTEISALDIDYNTVKSTAGDTHNMLEESAEQVVDITKESADTVDSAIDGATDSASEFIDI